MKILFLSHRIPYPPTKGDKLRAFNIIKHLCKEHEIYLVSLYDDKKDKKYLPGLKQFCRESSFFYLNPWLAKIKGFFCLFFNQPVTLGYFYSRKMQRKVKDYIKTKSIDLIFVYSSSVAQYVMDQDLKKIIDFVDCDSSKWKQYSAIAGFPLSFIYSREHRLLRDYEKRIAQAFDHSIVATEGEKKEFAEFISTEKFTAVANGVDTGFFKPVFAPQEKKLIFTGAMDYFANIDGIIYFCNEILPLIRERIPEVKFYIVGSNPARSVRALSNGKDIFVTGFVEDIREYLKDDAICVIPLRVTQGIQNKVLEAMASGLSVVITSKAVLGLKPQADKNVLVADNPQDFASKVIMLLEDGDLRRRLGELARKYVEENYNWERNISKLDEILKSMVKKYVI
jgi:sugar transferase (PEP-CTERM/EpsH1 system associated)